MNHCILICVFKYSRYTYTWDRPVCVESCNSLPSVGVERLSLLQQDALHQPGDVHIDVAREAVQIGYIGSYPCQEVRGTGNLLGGLVVIGHSHDDSGETCLTNVTCHWAEVDWGWTDGTLKWVKRAMVTRRCSRASLSVFSFCKTFILSLSVLDVIYSFN